MILLAIDIGNTNTTVGAYRGDKLEFVARLTTDRRRTCDQYAIELRDILHINKLSTGDISGAVISSVVPAVGTAIKRAIFKICGIKTIMLGPGVKTGLDIKIDNPAQLGADLAAGAVAALNKYPLPCIIIDLGTASTLSVLSENGEFMGGVIAAGAEITLEALATKTAQLPYINLEAPPFVIGTNTIDCMKSGIVLGTASMLDGMISRIQRQLGKKATVVATGGVAGDIVPHCETEIIMDEHLILEGLRIIYYKNQK